ncbi:class I SAM-dependent methyltransferase [Alcanivorax sp. DP30]|uniref:methyltransferase n=1 Tax=Alcanivorax sp. DP30 TaxID=2606217 RepID=UPI001370AD96|nr:class I SAM-dependent methyltransferase [Alcanivorax sp. DP30]MZR61863.1 methyltransferase [Alcanivorax sp. DP30]
MYELTHPWGTLSLYRWPRRRNETLQAWDNADQYLLNTLEARAQQGKETLVINDSHGALSLAAGQRGAVIHSGDSWLAQYNIQQNADENSMAPIRHCWPDEPLDAAPDQVVMRVPKSLALLESQLAWLGSQLPEGTPVWLSGMDKHLPRQLVPMMQRYLGNGQAEYGWKKARLFSATAPGKILVEAPFPCKVEGPAGPLVVHAGVFSQQQLDIGARFFLEHLPESLPEKATVADLGCGNGVIGLGILRRYPHVQLTFCDESWLALKSARENVGQYCPHATVTFHHGDGLSGVNDRFDCILLNPPFHDGHTVGDHVARRLFRQASKQLAEGGELRVIGNRHLGYHKVLGRLFSDVQVAGSNKKFVVFSCRAPK